MTIDIGTFLALALPIAGVGTWLLRLEGRLNMVERLTDQRYDDIKKRLERIEGKIDGAQGLVHP